MKRIILKKEVVEHEIGRHAPPVTAPALSVVNIQQAGDRATAAAAAFAEKPSKPRTLGDWLGEALGTILLIVIIPPTILAFAFAAGAVLLGGWLALVSVANGISAATCEPLSLWCWTPGQALFVTVVMAMSLLVAGAVVVDLVKDMWRSLHTLPGQQWPKPGPQE